MVSTGRLKRLSSVAAAVLAAFASLAAAPARAASDAEEAEALIREGVRLRSRDNAAQALPVFEKAYQISRTPRLLRRGGALSDRGAGLARSSVDREEQGHAEEAARDGPREHR